MSGRLRDYIRVYDAREAVVEIQKKLPEEFNDESTTIDVRGFSLFQTVPLYDSESTENAALVDNDQRSVFLQYLDDIGVAQEGRFNNAAASFSMNLRKFEKDVGFQAQLYDNRGFVTAPIFLSMITFLNDSDLSIVFNESVAIQPIRPAVGRTIVFPSSWQYPYMFPSPSTDAFILKTSVMWAEPVDE